MPQHQHERELGNDAFAAGQHDAAALRYTRALAARPDAVLFSNRAAAYLGKRWWPQALADVESALALRPDWGKAWGRKASALAGMGRHAEAAAAAAEGLRHDPGSAVLESQRAAAQRAQQPRREVQPAQPAVSAARPVPEGVPPSAARSHLAPTDSGAAAEAGPAGSRAATLLKLREACGALRPALRQVTATVAVLEAQLSRVEAALGWLEGGRAAPAEALPREEEASDVDLPVSPAAANGAEASAGISTGTPPSAAPSAAPSPAAGSASSAGGSSSDSFELVDAPPASTAQGSGIRSSASEDGSRKGPEGGTAAQAPAPPAGPPEGADSSGRGSGDGSVAEARSPGSSLPVEEEEDASSSEDDGRWLEAVHAARRQLAGEGGRIQPPGAARAAAARAPPQKAASAVGLSDLGALFSGGARSRDPAGVARAACKRCGAAACPQFASSPSQVHEADGVTAEPTYESFQRAAELRR